MTSREVVSLKGFLCDKKDTPNQAALNNNAININKLERNQANCEKACVLPESGVVGRLWLSIIFFECG